MYNINFWLSFCDSFLFCFVFSFYLIDPTGQVVFTLSFLKRVFVSQGFIAEKTLEYLVIKLTIVHNGHQ